MFQAVSHLTQVERDCRIAFLQAADRMTIDERAELDALTRRPFVPHLQRTTAEIKNTLAYQRRLMGEQSACVRIAAKHSLANRRELVRTRRPGETHAQMKAANVSRRTLATYIAAWAETRAFVLQLETELAQRGETFAVTAAA